MPKFKPGDTVYFIENGFKVVEAKVAQASGGFYSLRFQGMSNDPVAGIRLRESRLYASEEEAKAAIKK